MGILNKCPFDPTLEANRQVFDHIKNLSAHSEISEILVKSLKPCGDVQVFSPDISNCRYLTVSTQGIIFGLALEMHIIAFRLNKKMKEIALKTGARTFPECGEDWVNVWPPRGEWPRVDYEFWALKAYLNIRESVGLA